MTGLTNEQVQQRIEEGKINVNENPNTRSYKQIVRENVLTFFNFLNLALMIMVLLVGSYKNSMFMGIIVINTVIGIIQEVRAKKTLDKLSILTESKAVVLREGKKWSISTEKLVLDDISQARQRFGARHGHCAQYGDALWRFQSGWDPSYMGRAERDVPGPRPECRPRLFRNSCF